MGRFWAACRFSIALLIEIVLDGQSWPNLSVTSSSVSVREFCGSHSVHIPFGEFADAVKRILQFLLIVLEVFVAGIWRYGDELAEAHQDAGERFWNDEAVPGIQDPGVFDGDVEHAHGNCGRARQGYRAGLYFVARAAGAIDAEGDRPAFLQGAAQAEQGAHGVAAAGAFDGDESEFVDDGSHVFAIVAVAAHHANPNVAEEIRRGDDARVPKRKYQR